MFTEEHESESDTDTTVTTKTKKVKKPIKPRKVVDVVYLNDLPTVYVAKTLKQKVRGNVPPLTPYHE